MISNHDLSSLEWRNALVSYASQVFERNKGHLGVINMLRMQGLSNESAVEVSYEIFDDAKRLLRKGQRLTRIISWILIVIAGLLFAFMIYAGGVSIRMLAFAVALAFFGVTTLMRLPNPKKLPRNFTQHTGIPNPTHESGSEFKY